LKQKIQHTELNPIKHELRIEFEWAEVEERIEDTLKEFTKNSTIKGFRKGKAPKEVVRTHIGEKRIRERAAEKTAYAAFNEATKNSESTDPTEQKTAYPQPLTPPEIKLNDIVEGEPVKFTATYYSNPPDGQKLADEYKKKHMPEFTHKFEDSRMGGTRFISPEDVFPQGPPNIQSHGPYSVPTDVLKGIPGREIP